MSYAIEHAAEIGVYHLFPSADVDICYEAVVSDRSVADQHVYLSQNRYGLVDGYLNRIGMLHIASHRHRACLLPEQVCRCLRLMICENHLVAGSGELPDGFRAYLMGIL